MRLNRRQRKTGSAPKRRLFEQILNVIKKIKLAGLIPVSNKKMARDRLPGKNSVGKNSRIFVSFKHIHRKVLIASCAAVAAAIIMNAVVPAIQTNKSVAVMAKNASLSGQTIKAPAAAPEASSVPSAQTPAVTAQPADPLGDMVFNDGSTDPLVAFIQQRLMDLNYMEDAPTDNVYGPMTKQSVMLFQRQEGLTMNGVVDSKLYTLLMSPDAPQYAIGLGAQGTDVSNLISRLYELGYLNSPPDTFTAAVKTAVEKFQQANGLSADGMIGTNTKEMLYSDTVTPNTAALSGRILTYQKQLQQLGYLTTAPDGTYGADTTNAVKRFQNLNGLIVDGYLGPQTISVLGSGNAQANALILGMNGSDITRVQQRLSDLNYIGSVTGYFGSVTEDGVKAFQKRNGLSVDGKIGQNTMNAIIAGSAKAASNSISSNSGSSFGSGSGSSGKTSAPAASSSGSSGYVENFIAVAKSKLGSSYILGAKGPNTFDCSGFVYWCLNHSGVTQSYMTSAVWQHSTNYQRINGMNNLKRGDVISFKGHVGIYLGNDSMISALDGIQISNNIWNSSYWKSHFVCGFRIF